MMLSCWRETAGDRPSFAELVQRLDELLSAMLPDEVRQLTAVLSGYVDRAARDCVPLGVGCGMGG